MTTELQLLDFDMIFYINWYSFYSVLYGTESRKAVGGIDVYP